MLTFLISFWVSCALCVYSCSLSSTHYVQFHASVSVEIQWSFWLLFFLRCFFFCCSLCVFIIYIVIFYCHRCRCCCCCYCCWGWCMRLSVFVTARNNWLMPHIYNSSVFIWVRGACHLVPFFSHILFRFCNYAALHKLLTIYIYMCVCGALLFRVFILFRILTWFITQKLNAIVTLRKYELINSYNCSVIVFFVSQVVSYADFSNKL